MISRFICLFLLCWSSSAFSALPPVTFFNVSSTEGLPQNTGRVLLQDQNDFIWVGTEDGLVRFDGYSVLSFRKQHDNVASLSDNYISALAESRDGRIWVGTMGGGLNVIQPQTGTVIPDKYLPAADILAIVSDPPGDYLWLGTGKGLYRLNISGLADLDLVQVPLLLPGGIPMNHSITGVVVSEDEVWFSTRGSGIGLYKPAEDSVTWYRAGERGLKDDTFNMITMDQRGNIWAGGQNRGLVQVVRQGDTTHFAHYDKENSGLVANDVMAIADADDGRLWVGSWNGGLALFNPVTGKAELYLHSNDDPDSLASNIVMDILQARDGQIWVGTFDRGVCWFDPAQPFRSYKAKADDEGGLPGNLIWSFASNNDKDLWVGSAKGLARLNLDTHEYETPEGIQPVSLWDAIRRDDIRAMQADDEGLWIAARHSGLVRLSFSTGQLTPITELLIEGSELTHSYVRLIMQDSQGFVWLGATKGLNRFDPISGELRTYMPEQDNALSLPHYRVRALYEDSKGQIWVGTSQGLMLIDEQGDPLRVWQYAADSPAEQVLAGNGVRGIGEDSLGRIWIATEGGVSVYDRKTGKVWIIREQDGLPNNAAYCVIPVGQYMWVSTLRGLARIDIASLQVESYSTSDGLPGDEFNFNAWHTLIDGRLAFGTLFGFTVFSPGAVPGPERPDDPPPLWLRSYLYGEDNVRTPVVALDGSVDVDWRNNHIAFEYSALNFGSPQAVLYDIYLQGVDRDWSSVGTQRRPGYSGLAPGRYAFQVRARDSHGQWSVESDPVVFTVQAPPWKTLQAFILYAVLTAGGISLAVVQYNRRLRQRTGVLQNMVAQRTTELEDANLLLVDKNSQLNLLMSGRERLFRAVSHELRTPLTVIMSVVESVQRNEPGALSKVPMAYQSGQHLGQLLNSILDLSCREDTKIQDIKPFRARPALLEAASPYKQQAEAEGKQFELVPAEEDIWLGLPRESFMMMVSNLLSNACKYTDSGGNISLRAAVIDRVLRVEVEDDGIGVAEGMEERIFDWFERGDAHAEIAGWGIGLAFVREASEAAGGSIQLNSDADTGARFALTLPVVDVPLGDRENSAGGGISTNVEPLLIDQETVRTIVLVEDDQNLLQLLPTLFPSHWICLTASTAESGWGIVVEKEPDLVLTDLMLPGESGFDLTKRLKEDDRTSHIPVIILTALSDEEYRLAGLGLSADSFMSKPFDNHELLVRIHGLISNRERVFRRAKQVVLGMGSETKQSKKGQHVKIAEDDFLQKLHVSLDDDLDLSSITLDDVAGRLAMSKRSFQREMQRLGMSWREYKQLHKLRIAMDLLRDPTNLVGTVAEQAGYSSSAHFSKIFKKHTGLSPTEWRRKQPDVSEHSHEV